MKTIKRIVNSKTWRINFLYVAIFCIGQPEVLRAQGPWRNDEGHGCINGHTVFANWNYSAGKDMPKKYEEYPEFLPFLNGWDFRINLPHVKFQLGATGKASIPALVGVVEGKSDDLAISCKACYANNTMAVYGHINNSIWTFRVVEQNGSIYYKVLPSRRDLNSSVVENVTSLSADWIAIPKPRNITFKVEKPAVTVLGEGIGLATIYIIARDANNQLFFSKRLMSSSSTSSWTEPWIPLGINSKVAPSLITAFENKLAMAYVDANYHVKVQLYDPLISQWSDPVQLVGLSGLSPQLLWDGIALNVLASINSQLKYTYTTTADPLSFPPPSVVSTIPISEFGGFNGVIFNNRIHVVFTTGGNTPEKAWYATSLTPFGQNALWAPVTYVGFKMRGIPKIAILYENIYVMANNESGQGIIYSRKDPNSPGVEITGLASSDQWLEQGTEIDGTTPGYFGGFDVISFNSDIYLATRKYNAPNSPEGTYIINFSRAAMKHLLTDKWGMKLISGEPGGFTVLSHGKFANENETPFIGDFDGDRDDDIIKFNRKPEPGVGPAPVYVSLSSSPNGTHEGKLLWHKSFAPLEEIPMIGDFNGDGKDDIITFTQGRKNDLLGNEIGPAVVSVALSDGTKFGDNKVWHKFFSLKGEIPMVGDFNGDGKDDIITFTQEKQEDAAGREIGPAVVWVSLSDGTQFRPSKIWHKFFSLKGELPMVGDFNGDGKDDIVTFVQHSQYHSNGTLLGHAPVWVSLSDGTKFGRSNVWHTFFSLKGELPRIGDVNMDGKADIITFIRGNSNDDKQNDVYLAYSLGNKFDRSITWESDFVNRNQLPFIGHSSNQMLKSITDKPGDSTYFPDIFAFGTDGSLHVSYFMRSVSYPAGAPWERHKWFTDKGIGVAQFPEWIYEHQRHCISSNHRVALIGAGGTGSESITNLSVRAGSRAGHVLQELGHSIFANCFRVNRDPFGFWESIFDQSYESGGVGSADIIHYCTDYRDTDPDVCKDSRFYDCRDVEHIFLGLMVKYRLNGDEFRERMKTETNPVFKEQLKAAYQWLKLKWFNGLEFKRGVAINASLIQDGVPCLTDECQ